MANCHLHRLSAERLHQLRLTKIKILEIIWSYLYSGREQEAWHTLNEMWPATDFDRIRTAIISSRAHGIRAQTQASSNGIVSAVHKKHAHVFDAENKQQPSRRLEVIPPEPILLRRPASFETQAQALPDSELLLELVIDSAGKVRSAQPSRKSTTVNSELMTAALNWTFI